MIWRACVAVVSLVACESTSPPPAPRAEPAVAPIDAAPVVVDAAGRLAGAVDLGAIGHAGVHAVTGVRALTLAGDHVYWSIGRGTEVEPHTSVRRIARTGGTVVELATMAGRRGDALAVLGDTVYATGMLDTFAHPITRNRAALFRIEGGALIPAARGPAATFASSSVVAHEGSLYWVAASSMGPGPILATTAKGATRPISRCPRPALDDCAGLLPGMPPLVSDATGVWLAATSARVKARCPCGSIAARSVGDHVRCAPMEVECEPISMLIRFDGGATVPDELGDDPQLAGGHYYHLLPDSLVRRATLDGRDEVVAAGASMFTTDQRSVAWIEGDRLWIAPH